MTRKNVILIDIIDPKTTKLEAQKRMIESENLVNTFWGFVIIKKIQKRQIPDYKTFIWSWKLEELRLEAIEHWVKLIIVNNQLKSQQLFNIERRFEKDWIKIWTRVDLILKIFEKHAVSTESKLQIELAAIDQMWPRIFGMWMDLSRQAWWIWTKWIWETNTEIMKRHLAKQKKKIKDRLIKIWNKHELHRNSRIRKNFKTVAIVWYTNAWKSQLLRSLTKKKVKVQNELFATLDTRIGELYLPNMMKSCLVSDTIWFIQNLPPSIIEAFKSTLDETIHADLLIHVVDFSDKDKYKKIKVVQEILNELWVSNKPTLIVWNKIDLVKNLKTKTFLTKYVKYKPTFISALNKDWIKDLIQNIENYIV